jgi:tryptophan synthase alpha chain
MTVASCRGFVYATALMGVTGARTAVSQQAPDLVARVRAVDPEMPVGVGLGVGNGVQAAEVAAFADGVIVGSALIRCVLDAPDEATGRLRLRALSAELAEGVRAPAPL